jgi:hypothetical protein
MNKATILIIDQIRANLKIDSPYAKKESSVGEFADYKSATNITSLHHAYSQWMFLSKGSKLTPSDPLGIDGWVINVSIEKNKNTQSGYSVSLLFDKKYGCIPVLSEFYFLSNQTPWESKITKKADSKLCYPLAVKGDARSRQLEFHDPGTGEVFKSDKFTDRTLIQKYSTDAEFRKLFDMAVDFSVDQRIRKGMLRSEPVSLEADYDSTEE